MFLLQKWFSNFFFLYKITIFILKDKVYVFIYAKIKNKLFNYYY